MSHREPIVQERSLPAPPQRVFEAWSDPASLSTWMCPGEIASAKAEVDFRVGGRFRIVMQGEREYVQHGEYLEIDPPRRLVFTWISEFVPAEVAHTRVVLTLDEEEPGRTRLRLVHEIPDTDVYDGHVKGWADILARLAGRLESRPARSEAEPSEGGPPRD